MQRLFELGRTANPSQLVKEIHALPTNPAGPKMMGVCCLLFGLALENLLKGIYLAEHPQDVRRIRKLWGSKGHDLNKLAKGIGLALTDAESKLLSDLTEQVTWRSRYPVGFTNDTGWTMQYSPVEFDKLYARLLERFTAADAAWRMMAAQCVDADGVPRSP